MSSHDATVPAAVAAAYPNLDAFHPTIAEVYQPGTGWLTLRGLPQMVDRYVLGGVNKRISPAYARKLAREGVTAVALNIGGGRIADFTIAELCQRDRKVAA